MNMIETIAQSLSDRYVIYKTLKASEVDVRLDYVSPLFGSYVQSLAYDNFNDGKTRAVFTSSNNKTFKKAKTIHVRSELIKRGREYMRPGEFLGIAIAESMYHLSEKIFILRSDKDEYSIYCHRDLIDRFYKDDDNSGYTNMFVYRNIDDSTLIRLWDHLYE
jgi:hypothetical protein